MEPYIIGDNLIYKKLKYNINSISKAMINRSIDYNHNFIDSNNKCNWNNNCIRNNAYYNKGVNDNNYNQEIINTNNKKEEWKGQIPSHWKSSGKLILRPILSSDWKVSKTISKKIIGNKLTQSVNSAHEIDLIGKKKRVNWEDERLRNEFNLKPKVYEYSSFDIKRKIPRNNEVLDIYENENIKNYINNECNIANNKDTKRNKQSYDYNWLNFRTKDRIFPIDTNKVRDNSVNVINGISNMGNRNSGVDFVNQKRQVISNPYRDKILDYNKNIKNSVSDNNSFHKDYKINNTYKNAFISNFKIY